MVTRVLRTWAHNARAESQASIPREEIHVIIARAKRANRPIMGSCATGKVAQYDTTKHIIAKRYADQMPLDFLDVQAHLYHSAPLLHHWDNLSPFCFAFNRFEHVVLLWCKIKPFFCFYFSSFS